MNADYARRWLSALNSDVDALVTMYAEEPVVELGTYVDSVGDAVLSREDLRRELARYSNTDPANGLGIHTFELDAYEGTERHGVIRWRWTGRDLATFRGLPAAGAELSTVGQSFQQYGADGLIVRESTYWNDLRPLQTLGVKAEASHYWNE
jgi:steroid delta-isomerase-like uncharacterized protein